MQRIAVLVPVILSIFLPSATHAQEAKDTVTYKHADSDDAALQQFFSIERKLDRLKEDATLTQRNFIIGALTTVASLALKSPSWVLFTASAAFTLWYGFTWLDIDEQRRRLERQEQELSKRRRGLVDQLERLASPEGQAPRPE